MSITKDRVIRAIRAKYNLSKSLRRPLCALVSLVNSFLDKKRLKSYFDRVNFGESVQIKRKVYTVANASP